MVHSVHAPHPPAAMCEAVHPILTKFSDHKRQYDLQCKGCRCRKQAKTTRRLCHRDGYRHQGWHQAALEDGVYHSHQEHQRADVSNTLTICALGPFTFEGYDPLPDIDQDKGNEEHTHLGCHRGNSTVVERYGCTNRNDQSAGEKRQGQKALPHRWKSG